MRGRPHRPEPPHLVARRRRGRTVGCMDENTRIQMRLGAEVDGRFVDWAEVVDAVIAGNFAPDAVTVSVQPVGS